MKLNNLTILNYKNIEQAEFSFSPKLNCFVGKNGVGKTNILDAIYFLSFCKSSFNPIDSQNIRHDADFLMLQGTYRNDDDERIDVSCGIQHSKKKTFKYNGKEYKRLSEHIGRIPLVLISPNDNDLILAGSEERRKFMDMVISQYDNQYLYEVIRYRKALKERNALLKQLDTVDSDYIAVFEEIMADAGQKIYAARKTFLDKFVPRFQQMYSHLAAQNEKVSLEYICNCDWQDMRAQLASNRMKESIVGFSLYGVHRDDLDMKLGDYPLRREGSQGQTKTFLIALKFAQFEFLREHVHALPILLLDDIFDKLDSMRVNKILDLVSGNSFGQIFITDTDRNFMTDLIAQNGSDNQLYEVSEGAIIHAIS